MAEAVRTVWLRGKNGRIKNDLSLPYGNDDSEGLAEQIRQDFNAGKDLLVNVMKFMGQEMISSYESFDRVNGDDLDYHW
ncbi:hypothetical protein CVIRNUC_007207 [Coccomyxa viridis]|uniref:Translation initiation factor 5A C-terminal domain-containing protein n=1 Tax=Coccomyxa viridis TaxID=1274662 RepID=A0AAV1I9F9_9CHLO|nr:hypothetical protein CVIRNUC_007207 [Coccomyxa viridis]